MMQTILMSAAVTIVILWGYTIFLTRELGKMEHRIDQKIQLSHNKANK